MTTDAEQRQRVLAEAHAQTQAIRGGHHRTHEMEHSEPLFLTSSYVFESAADAAQRFSGDIPGNVYSRYTNPTVRIFEERIAMMEGAEDAVATSSGMAAILAVCMAFLKQGDHVVSSRSIFGATNVVFNRYFGKLGVETTYVPLTDIDAWRAAVRQGSTRLFYLETPSNPLSEIADIAAIAKVAHEAGALLVVDNCFCTPALQQPLVFGADIVLHSATKFIDGQGRALGGVVAGRREHMAEVLGFIRSCGPSMSPFNAWIFLKGLETLSLRMQAHCANAQALAEWLNAQDGVEQVFYAGLPGHPGHALARRQQSAFGGVLSFRVKGDKAAAWRFIDATRLVSITANLGDAKTTIVHPATTTHARVSPEDRAGAGITDNLIRVAVGLEHVEDLIADMARGLAAL